jgi:phosphohistidine phosphatase
MKTLLLLRHAKSSWDDSSLPDFERPLAPRGLRDAPRIGAALRKHGVIPDTILSSPAARARQTIEAVIRAAGLGTAEFKDNIYAASAAELIKIVRGLPDSSACAMLVGHNPGFEDLLNRLIDSNTETMPTCALACVDLQVDSWADIEDSDGRLLWLLRPKELNH